VNVNIFATRCCGFAPNQLPVVQLFGTVNAAVVEQAAQQNTVLDVYQVLANGQWTDWDPTLSPFQNTWSVDCGYPWCENQLFVGK
jgi:hypothetical protein